MSVAVFTEEARGRRRAPALLGAAELLAMPLWFTDGFRPVTLTAGGFGSTPGCRR